MKCSKTLGLAILALACVFSVASGNLAEAETQLLDDLHRVPYASSEFYVRFQSRESGKLDKLCGGVRMSKGWILTAAECLDKTQYTHIRLSTLVNKVNVSHVNARLRQFSYLHHAKYDNKTKANNLALVKINFEISRDNFTFTELPRKSDLKKSLLNELAVITGFDNMTQTSGFNQYLTVPTVNVKIVDLSVCAGMYPSSAKQEDLICALPIVAKGPTQDYIGAPLTSIRNRKLYGIVSNVRTPSKEGVKVPILFTKVAPYTEWISSFTGIRLEA